MQHRVRCSIGLCHQFFQQLLAGLLAVAAGFLANPAVGHPLPRMRGALVAAELAGQIAVLQGRALQRRLGGGLAREDRAGSGAEVGAIEVEPDAARQHGRVRFAQASVGAGGTSPGAGDTGFDAGRQRPLIGGRRIRWWYGRCKAGSMRQGAACASVPR